MDSVPDKRGVFSGKRNILKESLRTYHGKSAVVVYCKAERAVNRLGHDWMVEPDPDLIYELEEWYGKENIRFRSLGL